MKALLLRSVAGLTGNVSSGLFGNVAGIRGDVDACGITAAERATGVEVSRLIQGGK